MSNISLTHICLYFGKRAIISDKTKVFFWPQTAKLNIGDAVIIDPNIIQYVSQGLIKIKPVLRGLDDMREQEAIEILGFDVEDGEYDFEDFKIKFLREGRYTPDEFSSLIERNFDLFDLVDNNLAIDYRNLSKTT